MTNKFDKLLEFVVLGGFLGLCFALIHWVVPEKNAQHFGQALGAFTVIATLVAKSLWERGSATAIIDEKKTDNTGKAFEAIAAAAASTPADPAPAAADAADQVADAAAAEADKIKGND
ncbi:hypothetical protein [Sphingopyxis macrogoltabida]|uniref:Uncharacterized protein n=1 Tax=Sphingopyxis macrogoltabida TaxID=33050 RepID=A0A0N9USH0_SPHMC|nr:hypothetical protein [Sphingopyxis macrogoltabida]ALH82898.1 hypothetical protein AN936_21825 [Sphingopyxis macrogoltabida]